jgi:hypothetical protein
MFIKNKMLPRRTLLRGAGAALSLPILKAMMPAKASAADALPKRFFGFFYPNGTDPGRWQPHTNKLEPGNLSSALQNLTGFGAEGIWPSCEAIYQNITVVNNINHEGLNTNIHTCSMALQAYKKANSDDASTPAAPSLDMLIAQKHAGPYPYLTMSASTDLALSQKYVSWVGAGTPADTERDPRRLFNKLWLRVYFHANTTARFIDQIDGFIRKLPVCNVTL